MRPVTLSPNLLWLEVTNRCNANCSFCKREYVTDFTDMDFELYKKIIDSVPNSKEVHPQGFGEPLLYPHFVEAVSYAKRRKKRVVFYTNGSLLTEALAEALLDLKLDEIRFSVDACDEASFESLRRGLSWQCVVNRIEGFQKLKKSRGYGTLTAVQVIILDRNVSKVIDFWRRKVDKVYSTPKLEILSPLELEAETWSYGKVVRCGKPFKHLSVKSNGELVVCCRDLFNNYVIENLHNVDVSEAFNSSYFNQIRTDMTCGRRYPRICDTCVSPWRK